MSNANRVWVVIRARSFARYPVAAFSDPGGEERAQIYSDWCSRSVPLADHSVVAVPLNPHLTRSGELFMKTELGRALPSIRGSVCSRGFARSDDCDSSLCRERGCHAPRFVTEKNPEDGKPSGS